MDGYRASDTTVAYATLIRQAYEQGDLPAPGGGTRQIASPSPATEVPATSSPCSAGPSSHAKVPAAAAASAAFPGEVTSRRESSSSRAPSQIQLQL